MTIRFTNIILTILLLCVHAAAHEGRPHGFSDVMQYWGKDPFTIILLAISGVLYWLGIKRLRSRAGPNGGIRTWEAWMFAAAWFSLVVALLSPLHPLGEVLFSAHMTQHEVLMLVSAPLLVLGRPIIALLWALPLTWRTALGSFSKGIWFQRIWRSISFPLSAWAIHLVVLWSWHVPALFESTLRSGFVHFLQHFSFLASALLFWWALMHGAKGLLGYGMAVLYVFSTAAHSGLLGALITFATALVYPAYAETSAGFGLTPIEDQQLGGLIMWIPGGVLYTIAGLALLAGWIREAEVRALRSDRVGRLGETLAVRGSSGQ